MTGLIWRLEDIGCNADLYLVYRQSRRCYSNLDVWLVKALNSLRFSELRVRVVVVVVVVVNYNL